MNAQSVSGFGYAKALIFGEYAVMYGAPGLVAALDPAVRVALKNAVPKADVDLNMPPAVEKLLNILKPSIPAEAEIENRAFFDADHIKYGIGSSAATVTALVQAHRRLCARSGLCISDASGALAAAIEAHRTLQNGMGSGIDVIASALGGCLIVRNCPHEPQITRIPIGNLPPFAFFTMHRTAPTLPFIEASERARNTKSGKKVLDALASLYSELSEYALRGNKKDFIERLADVPALLNDWSRCMALPVLPPEFDEMRAAAADAGAVLKTAGAGGGDLLIACAEKDNNIDSAAALLSRRFNLTRLRFGIAPAREYP